MGLNKLDIRAVIHYVIPNTMEHYVQEIGRAGRDGEPAYCHLFFNPKDLLLRNSLVYSDGIDLINVRKILEVIFKQGKKKIKPVGKVNYTLLWPFLPLINFFSFTKRVGATFLPYGLL
jgi:superfamily II DNA/RNA helicase